MSRIDKADYISQIGSEAEEGMDWAQELSDSSGMANWAFPIAPGTRHLTGVAQRRPRPVGHFKTRVVKPILPFLTTLYLRARLVHQLARNVHVFHMQSIYIARQALHLTILLNDAVDAKEGPSDEQDDERNDLEDDLIELSKAMTEWGSDKGDHFEYEMQATEIEHQYAQLFKERFYFHGVRDCSRDTVYQKFVAYDAKTIRYRQRRETHITSPTTIKIKYWTETVEDESGSEEDTGRRFDSTIGSLSPKLGQHTIEGPPISEFHPSMPASRPSGDAQSAWLEGSEGLARKPSRLSPKSRGKTDKKDHLRKKNRAGTTFRLHLAINQLHVVHIGARKLVRRDRRRWRVSSPMSPTPPASSAAMLLASPTPPPNTAMISSSSPPIPGTLPTSSHSMTGDPPASYLPSVPEVAAWGDLEPLATHTVTHFGDLEAIQRPKRYADMITCGDGFTTLEQPIHSMPPLTPRYVERREATRFMEEVLLCHNLANKPGSKILVVTGLAGCGKTQLARWFVEKHGNEFLTKSFIDGSSERTFQRDIVRHLRSLSTSHSQKSFNDSMTLPLQLAPGGEKMLIIIDNADDPTVELAPFLSQWPNGTVIVTSRDRSRGQLGSSHLELDVMSQDEAVELLVRGSGRLWPPSDSDKDVAIELAKELGWLPIALTQAGSYMFNTGYSAEIYVNKFRTHRERLCNDPATNQVDMRHRTAYAAFDSSFEILSSNAREAMHLLSSFDTRTFVLEHVRLAGVLTDKCTFTPFGEEFERREESLGSTFYPSAQWDPPELDSLVKSLRNHSLIARVSTEKPELVEMHPMVHEWAQFRLHRDKQGGDWQYSTPFDDQLLNFFNVYPQQFPLPQITAHDLNLFHQNSSVSPYDLGTVCPQAVDRSQITNALRTSSLVDSLYPFGAPSYMQYRSRLIKLLDSPCIRDSTAEDAKYTKYFFLRFKGESGVVYRCSVKDCTQTFSRLDRATNHFRVHIQHRPFECEGCDKENCHVRFYSKETRRAHMIKKMATCGCGCQLEARNLKRHQEQSKGCTTTHTAEC